MAYCWFCKAEVRPYDEPGYPVTGSRRCERCYAIIEHPTRKGQEMGPATAAIHGVGRDAPITTNATGGKQSLSLYRADLLPPHALLAVAAVLKHGAEKYGENNWHAITVAEHLNHALIHLYALIAGDTQDEHLEHAACRILMGLDQARSGREDKLKNGGA